MTKKWKKSSAYSQTTFEQMMQNPPAKYIEQRERYCPHCNIFEVHIRGIKNLSKQLNKGFCQVIIKTVKENNIKSFTVKELIKLLNAEDITDGKLQRKALAILTVLGYYKKGIREYKNKKGEDRLEEVYHVPQQIVPSLCYNKEIDKHIDNWKTEAIEKNLFKKEEQNGNIT